MPQITIDFDEEENRNIEIFKAKESIKNKQKAVRLIIRKYFKIKETRNEKGWKR